MTDVPEAIARYLAKYPDGYEQDGDYSRFRFDQHGRCVIDRLAKDEDACAAISKIAKTDSEIWTLLELCMRAEMLMRGFHPSLIEKRKTFEDLKDLRKKVEDLRQFVEENYRIILNWPIPEAECQAGLDRIEALISLREQAAKSDLLDRGVTRKTGATEEYVAKEAPKIATIGWLAEQVRKTFGKPFAQHVAVLAEIALDIGEVPEERVRKALKTRQQKHRDAKPVRSTR